MRSPQIVLMALLIFGLMSPLFGQNSLNTPNILFILTDDQRYDAVGYAGNEIIQTPNMDQLAGRGIIFNNAFVTTPICAASRASIITGLYERTHGFTFGTPPLKSDHIANSYPSLLKQAGYRTGFIGKLGMHLEDQAEKEIFDYYVNSPMDAAYYIIEDGKHIHKTDFVKKHALQFLDSCDVDNPFCLSLSFNAPHTADADPRQYVWQKRYGSLYNDISIPTPDLSDPQYFSDLPDFIQNSEGRVRWYWRFDTPEKVQEMVKGYYRMITGVDDALGEIVEQLERKGLLDNTILIFCSDNGYFLGERGLAGKWYMYEQSIRIPFFITDFRQAPDGSHRDQMVLNIDIAPTILDYADIPIPKQIQGKSLKGVIEDPGLELREFFLCEHLFEYAPIPKSEGIRTKDWIYFRYLDHPEVEEMYHLPADPFETSNLREENPGEKKKLSNLLDRMLKKM